MSKTCYMCNNPAQSKEHVPAKGFFPEDDKFRMNLITVKSCLTHNEETSKDDQYIRDVVVMAAFGSAIAESQFLEKTNPFLVKQPEYLKLFIVETLSVLLGELKTMAFSVDRVRFDRTMRKYAYGLYYHKFDRHWKRTLTVVTGDLYDKDDSTKVLVPDKYGAIMKMIEAKYWPPPLGVNEGANPDVFKFCFIPEDGLGINVALIMEFYGKFKVWVFADNNECMPNL